MKSPSHVAIDGKWKSVQPTQDFGCLGLRAVCELEPKAGERGKRLLLRRRIFPASAGSSASLAKKPFPEVKGLGLREMFEKKYHTLDQAPNASAQSKPELSEFYQQDITGLSTLFQGVKEALTMGHPERVWQLYYNACAALDRVGEGWGRTEVPLQCPPSLAVAPNLKVVPLDAELQFEKAVPANSDMHKMYLAWFGNEGAMGFAAPDTASWLHARALRRYFEQLLQMMEGSADAPVKPAIAKMRAQFAQVPADANLQATENWIREVAEKDWGIELDEMDSKSTVEAVAQPPRRSRKLLYFSLLFNLLLLLLLLLLRWGPFAPAASAEGSPSEFKVEPIKVDNVFFGSYCVVFPTEGTRADNVRRTLEALFPKTVQELSRGNSGHPKMLQEKLKEVTAELGDTGELTGILDQLAKVKNVQFRGVSEESGAKRVAGIIERGGIFSFPDPKGPESKGTLYSSLLQPSGFARLIHLAEGEQNDKTKKVLDRLKRAVVEYASLQDALNITGERAAYLIHVEPTPQAHEQMRKSLTERLENPVFVSRPILELFDAVDPSTIKVGGSAEYMLTLDVPCFFRQVGTKHRSLIDYGDKNNKPSLPNLKWLEFAAGKDIIWEPVSLTDKDGDTAPIPNFEIAVTKGDKAVVFRNQNLFTGSSREQVKQQSQTYLANVLKLPTDNLTDMVKITTTITKSGQKFSGALSYSYLADLLREAKAVRVVEVQPLSEFRKEMDTENQRIVEALGR